jgi:hypothetical protein
MSNIGDPISASYFVFWSLFFVRPEILNLANPTQIAFTDLGILPRLRRAVSTIVKKIHFAAAVFSF